MAIAIGLGYLLGRRKKMRTAMTIGAAMAAGRISRNPAALLQLGGDLLGKSPVLGQVAGLSKPLTAAGKAAAAGVVSRGIDSVGDRIRSRTDALRNGDDEGEPDDQASTDEETDRPEKERRNGAGAADDYDDVDEDDYQDEDEPEPEPEQEAPRPRQRRGLRRPTAQADSEDSDQSPARRPDTGGAPVRRRVSKR
jgi:hypothetical protein